MEKMSLRESQIEAGAELGIDVRAWSCTVSEAETSGVS